MNKNIKRIFAVVLSLTMIIACNIILAAADSDGGGEDWGTRGGANYEVSCDASGGYALTSVFVNGNAYNYTSAYVSASLNVLDIGTGAVSTYSSGSDSDSTIAEVSHSIGSGHVSYSITSYHSATAEFYDETCSGSDHFNVYN